MQKILINLINFYQQTLSPDHGWFRQRYPYGYCRFKPTCSEYAKQAIQKKGSARGVWLAIKRLARCHPFNKGGYDPVI